MEKFQFSPGMDVVYGLHGRCSVTAIETREIGGNTQQFYRLEFPKNSFTRAKKSDASIMLPIEAAQSKGLRSPMNKEQADAALAILSNKEYYFSLDLHWKDIQPKLEKSIYAEGTIGLAKVVSYLFVLKNRDVVPPSQVTKFWDMVSKLLARELSDAQGLVMRDVEEDMLKRMKSKLQPDH